MCAIAGIIGNNKKTCVSELQTMLNFMVLRGPDEEGFFSDSKVVLGHRRLAIIDVKSGKQPISIDNGNYVIVHNGEIYNFTEVRRELEALGVDFMTESDSEVLLQSYRQWGIKGCLEKLDGMWAFAIYDKVKQKVYLSRDRLGEKPLYYYNNGTQLLFASELKAFQPNSSTYKIDEVALNLYLSLCYIPAPYTIYKGIKKLQAGHYLEVDIKSGKFSDCIYYDVLNERSELISNKEEACHILRDLLTDSVKKRMTSDVPVGAFLSGGIDSSIVCCLMTQLSEKPINTFSIGFKQKDYDESDRAKLVVDKIKSSHTQYILDFKDVINILDEIILYYDEPYADSSAIPSYYVAKLAREKVKVALTGDCADELFGGYEKYLAEYYVSRYKRIPVFFRVIFEKLVGICPITPRTNGYLTKIKKVINNAQLSGFDLYYNFMTLGFCDGMRKKVIKNEYFFEIKDIYRKMWNSIPQEYSYLQKEQMMDVMGVLEGDMFPKMDRACMHVSLENRAPFIDKRILKFAMNLSDELKIVGKNKKVLLKEAFKDILPADTLTFRKSGFGVPTDYWFRNELKEDLLKMLDKHFIEEQGLFNYECIKKIIDEHMNGKENNRFMLYNLYVFQKWYTMIYKAK